MLSCVTKGFYKKSKDGAVACSIFFCKLCKRLIKKTDFPIGNLLEPVLTIIGNHFNPTHIWTKYFWNRDRAVFILIVLKDGSDGTADSQA